MARTMTTIGSDDSAFTRVCAALNTQLLERGIRGDGDAMDMSFDVCLSDAVSILKGKWDKVVTATSDDYYVALDGAPLSTILPK